MSDENLTVNEDLPSWPEIQEHPDYINASPEDKLESFNRWRDVWTESFGNDLNVIEHPEVRNFFNITKSYELQLKKDALAGEESPWEDGAMLDDFHAYQKGRGQVAEIRADKTWYLDNAFNLHNKDIKPYEQRKPPEGVLSFVRSTLGRVDMPGQDAQGNKEEEYEIGSEQDYSDGYRFYDGDVKKSVVLNPSAREWLKKNVESREDDSFSWVVRDIGSFSDVKEINPFRSVLGADEFSEGLAQAEILNAREKAEALGEYPIHRQLAISRFKQYLTSRKQEGTQTPETPPTGMQKYLNILNQGASIGPSGPMLSRGAPVDYVFKSNNLGDPEIYTRNAPWFHLANEKSHLMKKVRENRVLENPDILTDPDKYKKLFSDYNDLDSLAPHKFIADYFLPKVGMEDVVNEIRDEGPKSEAYKQSLTDLMFDALLEMPAAWAEDMVVVERDGDYIVNPELYNTASEKELDQKLKDAGLDETERLLHTNIAANVQEEIAERQHYALLAGKSVTNAIKGAEQDYGQGEIDLAELMVNQVLDPMNGPYRAYLASLDRKGIKVTYKEAIDGFRDRLENPTDSENFAQFLAYASRSKTPLGALGQVLQTLENHDTIAGWGVGMQKAEEAALRELPMFAAGLYGIAETIFSDKDDTLRGINEFQSMLESQRAASGHPTGAKWGNIFGREIAYIALAKAVPGGGYTRMVEKGTSTLGRSIGSVRAAGARFIGGIKGTDQIKKLGLKVQQKFSHGATTSGKSLKADFFSKLPAKAYFTMQASRSGEAMYRESFLAHKQRLIDNGATAEEAHSFAGTLAAPTGILGALITGTLMKVIPGGTERLFEKGINKLTKPELLKALNISDKVYRAQLSDVTFRRQSRELLGDWFRVGQTEGSRKLVGRGLRGLRHLGKEAAEESIDEIFQGIIAMQTYDPDMTFEEVLSHAWDAAIAGGVLGGTMGLAASSPNEGVQGLSEVQRVQLNDLRNRSRELGANPDTQLTSEALDEVEKTLNAKYNADNAAAAEEAAETTEVVPDETSTPDKPSTTRDLVEGQPIFYILGDAFNEDGSFEVKEGIYERQEIGGAPVEVIFDPSAPENSPERVRPLRDTLGYSSRRDEMDAGTFAEGNAHRTRMLQDEYGKLLDEYDKKKIGEKEFQRKLLEINDKGVQAFGNSPEAVAVWNLVTNSVIRASGVKMDPLSGVEDAVGSVAVWGSEGRKEVNKDKSPRTREDFINYLQGNWTYINDDGTEVNASEGLFQGEKYPLGNVPGYLLTALDVAFGAVAAAADINAHAKTSQTASGDFDVFEKKFKAALKKLNTALNNASLQEKVEGKGGKNWMVWDAVGKFYNSINREFRTYTYDSRDDDGNFPGGINIHDTGQYYSGRIKGFLTEWKELPRGGKTPGYELAQFPKEKFDSEESVVEDPKENTLIARINSAERLERGLRPGEYISDLEFLKKSENYNSVYIYVDTIQSELEADPSTEQDATYKIYDKDGNEIRMLSYETVKDAYAAEVERQGIPAVPESFLKQIYLDVVISRTMTDSVPQGVLDLMLEEAEGGIEEDASPSETIDTVSQFRERLSAGIKDAWKFYTHDAKDTSPLVQSEEDPLLFVNEFIDALNFSDPYISEVEEAGKDPAKDEEALLAAWKGGSKAFLTDYKTSAYTQLEIEAITEKDYSDVVEAVDAQLEALDKLKLEDDIGDRASYATIEEEDGIREEAASQINNDVAETTREQVSDEGTEFVTTFVRSLSFTSEEDIIDELDGAINNINDAVGEEEVPAEVSANLKALEEAKAYFENKSDLKEEDIKNYNKDKLPVVETKGKFIGKELSDLGRTLVDNRVEDESSDSGVYVTFSDFTPPGASEVRNGKTLTRTGDRTNFGKDSIEQDSDLYSTAGGEVGVLTNINTLIHNKYPIKPTSEEEFRAPSHLPSLPDRGRVNFQITEETAEGEIMGTDGNSVPLSTLASKYVLPVKRGAPKRATKEVVFSNSPMHMAVALDYLISTDQEASITVPASFEGKLNPALVVEEGKVVGAKVNLGGLQTVGGKEGMTRLLEVHDQNVNSKVVEDAKSGTSGSIRNQDLLAHLADMERMFTTEDYGFTEEEIDWLWSGIPLISDEGARIDKQDERSREDGSPLYGVSYVINRAMGSPEIKGRSISPGAAQRRAFLSLLRTRILREDGGTFFDENGNIKKGQLGDLTSFFDTFYGGEGATLLQKDLYKLLNLTYKDNALTQLFGQVKNKPKFPNIEDHSFKQFYLDELSQDSTKKGAGEVSWGSAEIVSTDAVPAGVADIILRNGSENDSSTNIAIEDEEDFSQMNMDVDGDGYFDEYSESLPDTNPTKDSSEAPQASTGNKIVNFARQEKRYIDANELTPASRKTQLLRIKSEHKYLGLKDGDSSTIVTALKNIVKGAKNKKYPKWFGRKAQSNLDKLDRLDLANLELAIRDSYEVAGAYFKPKDGKSASILLSTRTLDTTGHVAGVLLHELEHRFLDDIIDNPQNEQEKLLVEEVLPLYLKRARTLFSQFAINRYSTSDYAGTLTQVSLSNWSEKTKRNHILKSNSIYASEYSPEMSKKEVDGILGEILSEEYGIKLDTANLREVAYILGVPLTLPGGTTNDFSLDPRTGNKRSEKYLLKEFLRGVRSSEVMQGYLRDLDAEASGGSLYTKLFRSMAYALNLGSSRRVQLQMNEVMDDMLSKAQRTYSKHNTFNEARLQAIKEKLGTTEEESSRQADYSASSAAVQASMPNVDLRTLNKRAVIGSETDPTLGGNIDPGATVDFWMLNNGSFIHTDSFESLDDVASEAFYLAPKFVNPDDNSVIDTSTALAFKSNWVQMSIGRDDTGNKTLTYSSAKPLSAMPLHIRNRLNNWANSYGAELIFNPKPYYKALADLNRMSDSSSVDAALLEGPKAQTFWSSNPQLSKARRILSLLNVPVVVGDFEKTSASPRSDAVIVPNSASVTEQELVKEGFRSSFKTLFTTGERALALNSVRSLGSEASIIFATAVKQSGSYEKLMSDYLTAAVYGDLAPAAVKDVDVSSIMNQALIGSWGPEIQKQVTTMLDVASNAADLKSSIVAVNGGVSNWDTHHTGVEALGLTISTETIQNLKEAAIESNHSVASLLEEYSTDKDFNDQVMASLAYQENKARSLKGRSADLAAYIARSEQNELGDASYSLPSNPSTSEVRRADILTRNAADTSIFQIKNIPGISDRDKASLISEVSKWHHSEVHDKEGRQKKTWSPNYGKKLSDLADYHVPFLIRDSRFLRIKNVTDLKKHIKAHYGNRPWADLTVKMLDVMSKKAGAAGQPLKVDWDLYGNAERGTYIYRDHSMDFSITGSPRSLVHEASHGATARWIEQYERRAYEYLDKDWRVQSEKNIDLLSTGPDKRTQKPSMAYGNVLNHIMEDKSVPAVMKDLVRLYRSAVSQAGLSNNLEYGNSNTINDIGFMSHRPDIIDAHLGLPAASIFRSSSANTDEESLRTHFYRDWEDSIWKQEEAKDIQDRRWDSRTKVSEAFYGFSSLAEFVAESWSSGEFNELLKDMAPVEGLESTLTEEDSSLLQQLKGLITALFKGMGIDLTKNKTLLDQVQASGAQIMNRSDSAELDFIFSNDPAAIFNRSVEDFSFLAGTEYDPIFNREEVVENRQRLEDFKEILQEFGEVEDFQLSLPNTAVRGEDADVRLKRFFGGDNDSILSASLPNVPWSGVNVENIKNHILPRSVQYSEKLTKQQEALGTARQVRKAPIELTLGVAAGFIGLLTGSPVSAAAVGVSLGFAGRLARKLSRGTYEEGSEELPKNVWVNRLHMMGVSAARINQLMTVEGRLGPKASQRLKELRGELFRHSSRARSHLEEIHARMESLFGTREVSEVNETTVGQNGEKYSLSVDINMMLGTTDEDEMMDMVLPPDPQTGLSQRELIMQQRRELLADLSRRVSLTHTESTKKREAGASEREINMFEVESMSNISKERETVNNNFLRQLTGLRTQAGNLYRNRQNSAEQRVKDFNENLFNALKQGRETLNDLQIEMKKYPELLNDLLPHKTEVRNNIESVLDSSLNIWLTRSYKSLEANGWDEFLISRTPEANEHFQVGFDHFYNELLEEKVRSLIKMDSSLSPIRAKILAKQNNLVTVREVQEKMNEWLVPWLDRGRTSVMPTGLMDATPLHPRTVDLPKSLRKYVGQHEDNVYNLARSISSLGSMIANYKFLKDIETQLLETQKESGTVLITSDSKEGGEAGLKPFVDPAIAHAHGGSPFGPLRGKWGPPEFVDALHELQPNTQRGPMDFFGNVASYTMANMTTRRLRTHVRNFLGNPIFLMNAGMPLRAIAHGFNLPISALTGNLSPGSPGTVFQRGLQKSKLGRAMLKNPSKVSGVAAGALGGLVTGDLVGTAVGAAAGAGITYGFTKNKNLLESSFGEEARMFEDEHARMGLLGSDVLATQAAEYRKNLKEWSDYDLALGKEGFLEQAIFSDAPAKGATKKMKKMWKSSNRFLDELYQGGDNYWKISFYEGELESMSKAFGLLGEDYTTFEGLRGEPARLRKQIQIDDGSGVLKLNASEKTALKILEVYGTGDMDFLNTPAIQALQKEYGARAAALEILKRAAADSTTTMMPTYSSAVEFVQLMKKYKITAFVAPFVSFPAEVIRIRLMSELAAYREYKLGAKHNVSGLKTRGIKRGMSALATLALAQPAYKAIGSILGPLLLSDGDDEEWETVIPQDGDISPEWAIKRIMPEFYRDSALSLLGIKRKPVIDENGNKTYSYVATVADMNYMYSFSPVDESIHLITNWPEFISGGKEPSMETMEARFKRGFEKLMMPFLSPQMWIDGPLSHQINLRDSLVAEIDKARGESNTITDLMNQIGKTAVPGTIMDMYEVISSASKGEVYDRGRITRPQTALIKQITGTNIIEVDPVELFKKALGVHKAAERDITGDFEKVFANSGGQQVTEKELREAASEIAPRLEQMSAEARGTYIGLKSLIGSREAFNVLAERINEKGSATGSIQWWNNIDQNRVNTPFTSEKIMKLVDRMKEADIRSQQVEEGKPETGIRFRIFNEYLKEINKGMGQGGSYINPAETVIPE